MSTTNDCPECGRPQAENHAQWINDLCQDEKLCGAHTDGVSLLPMAHENCRAHTINRLRSRITVLEQQLSPRLRVWNLDTGREIWCVATDAETCWNYLLDRDGDPEGIADLKQQGLEWSVLPDDKRISIAVDYDGDICGIDDGTPISLPCWAWAALRGAGFLAETE